MIITVLICDVYFCMLVFTLSLSLIVPLSLLVMTSFLVVVLTFLNKLFRPEDHLYRPDSKGYNSFSTALSVGL